MRLIIIFALASSKVLPSKENEMVSTRNDLRPQMARRRKGRPKSKSILKDNNENPMIKIKTEAEGSNEVLTENIKDDSNDNHSDFS